MELTPTGGTLSSLAGTTDSQGIFRTNATALAGAAQLLVEVVVRTPDGTELARTTVHATIGSVPDILGIWGGGGICGDTVVLTELRLTHSIEGPLAASVAATGVSGPGNGIQRVYGTWLLEERADGTFFGGESVSGLAETITLRLRSDGKIEGRVIGDPRIGPCRDVGGAWDFVASRISR